MPRPFRPVRAAPPEPNTTGPDGAASSFNGHTGPWTPGLRRSRGRPGAAGMGSTPQASDAGRFTTRGVAQGPRLLPARGQHPRRPCHQRGPGHHPHPRRPPAPPPRSGRSRRLRRGIRSGDNQPLHQLRNPRARHSTDRDITALIEAFRERGPVLLPVPPPKRTPRHRRLEHVDARVRPNQVLVDLPVRTTGTHRDFADTPEQRERRAETPVSISCDVSTIRLERAPAE